MSIKKLFVGLAVVALALSATVSIAGAQTLTANQIMAALTANPALLQSLTALLGGSTTSTGGSAMLTQQLAMGSKGAEVTALQNFLIGNGFTIPAGATGYFGAQTKAAVLAFQAAKGIAQVGQVGPQTRAAINAMMGTGNGGSSTLPAGCTSTAGFSSTTGAKCDGTTTGGGQTTISTPGVEGTLSASQTSAGVASTIYEGDKMATVLAVKVEAKNSDIAVQRVKLDLGADTRIYNKIYDKVYLTDGSNVLASADLNSSTVTKDSGRYYITLAGFSSIVAKNGSKVLSIKVDVKPTIDSTDIDIETYAIGLATDGIRGIDGAGIDQYAGGTSITKSMNVDPALSESASLTVSLNTNSPKAAQVVASNGSNDNELDGVTLLSFDLKAEKSDVKVTDLNIQVSKTGTGGALASSTVHLFDGSTELDNTDIISNDTAVFNDLDFVVSKDTTKTLTVKVDVRSANGTAAGFTATASSTGITAENPAGDTVTNKSGSATGESQTIVNKGPELTLISASAVTSGAPQGGSANTLSTSTLTATFKVRVKAVGGTVMFGNAASGTPMFAKATNSAGSPSFVIYRDGAAAPEVSSNATSTDITFSSDFTADEANNTYSLTDGQSGEVTVTYSIEGRKASGAALTSGLYAVQLDRIYSVATGILTSSFMSGKSSWRTTPSIKFP
jgi:peptidoglycan hydrolase-like protein with peptidoglycan-binding domain